MKTGWVGTFRTFSTGTATFLDPRFKRRGRKRPLGFSVLESKKPKPKGRLPG